MKYRDNMTRKEERMLLRELAILDAAYLRAASIANLYGPDYDVTDEMDVLRKAALNHRGQP